MGIFGRNPKLELSCFGKLRIYSDFIEPVHSTKIGNELRDWLTESVGKEELKVEGREPGPLVYRVAWPLRGGKDVLVAALWSSADAVGRWFPFSIYTRISQKRLRVESLPEYPLVVTPLWTDLQELAIHSNGIRWHELEAGQATERDIQRALIRARPEYQGGRSILGEFDESLRSLRALDFLEKLFSPSYWVFYPRTAWMLADISRNLRDDPSSVTAMRLPASDKLNAAYQTAFWLRVICGMAGELRRLPTLFLPLREAAEAGVWILFREPVALDLQALFGHSRGHSFLQDLRHPDNDAIQHPRFESFVEALQNRLTRDMTAMDLADLNLEAIRRESAGC